MSWDTKWWHYLEHYLWVLLLLRIILEEATNRFLIILKNFQTISSLWSDRRKTRKALAVRMNDALQIQKSTQSFMSSTIWKELQASFNYVIKIIFVWTSYPSPSPSPSPAHLHPYFSPDYHPELSPIFKFHFSANFSSAIAN